MNNKELIDIFANKLKEEIVDTIHQGLLNYNNAQDKSIKLKYSTLTGMNGWIRKEIENEIDKIAEELRSKE